MVLILPLLRTRHLRTQAAYAWVSASRRTGCARRSGQLTWQVGSLHLIKLGLTHRRIAAARFDSL